MSLEEALHSLAEKVERQNDLLEQVLGQAAKNASAKAESTDGKAAKSKAADDGDDAEPKAKATRRGRPPKTAADDGDEADEKPKKSAKGPTAEDAKALVSGWINEIEVEVDDDDNPVDEAAEKALRKRNARKAFVKKALSKLDLTGVGELAEPADIKKFIGWIETRKGGEDPFAEDDE